MSRRRSRNIRRGTWKRRFGWLLLNLVVLMVLLGVVLVLPWRWIAPPTTAFIVRAQIDADQAGGARVYQRWLSWKEISPHLEKCLSKVDNVLQYTVHETSIDDAVGKDRETPLSDVLEDPNGLTPEDRFLSQEANDDVGEIYCQLNEQQKTVLAYRFGLMGEPPLTLQQTGGRIGVSRERVRQIENQAKERMRKLFEKRRRINSSAIRPLASRCLERNRDTDH